MMIVFAVLLGIQAPATQIVAQKQPDRSWFTESTARGRLVGPTDAVALCVTDDESARRDMEAIAMATFNPDAHIAGTCTRPVTGDWRVVRSIADRCLVEPGEEWCDVEAHAVLVERQGRRRYAVILVTAAQLD